MIKYYLVIIIGLISLNALAAQHVDLRKKITVTGSAESSIQPDEFTLEITLNHKGKGFAKHSIAQVEKRFKKVLEKHNIKTDKLKFTGQNNYWYYWWRYRGRTDVQKTYLITLDNKTNLLGLMQDLDSEGIRSIKVANSTNTRLQELRKEVKIQAIKAAKEKASYLLEAVGEKIGGVISIVERADNNNHYYRPNLVSNVVLSSKVSTSGSIDNLPEIKLRYEVNAVFEISEE